MNHEVEITYDLDSPDEDEAFYKVDLECRISRSEQDVGWLGHLEAFEVLSVTPAWPHGLDRLYELLDSHSAEIEQVAFSAQDAGE